MSPLGRFAVAFALGSLSLTQVGSAAAILDEAQTAKAVAPIPASSTAVHGLHTRLPRRYLHGVYESDRDAFDAANLDQSGLASTIAEVVRRQLEAGATGSSNITSAGATGGLSSTPIASSTSVTPPPASTSETSSSTSASSDADSSSSTSESSESTSSSETSSTTSSSSQETSSQMTTSTSESSSTATTSSTSQPSESSTSDATTSASSTSERSTMTNERVTITTSSPVPQTLTRTLSDGGITTLTSTSWVAVVPARATSSSTPGLQNAASRNHGEAALVVAAGACFAGLMLA